MATACQTDTRARPGKSSPGRFRIPVRRQPDRLEAGVLAGKVRLDGGAEFIPVRQFVILIRQQ